MAFFPAAGHKLLALSLLAGLTAGFSHAQAPASSPIPASRITQPVDDAQRITLTGSLSPLVNAASDLGAAPDSLQLGRTILLLKSSDAQQAALKKLVDDQQNTKSPSYHAWLSPEQYGTKFGVTAADIAKLTAWLTTFGFQVEAPMAGQNILVFSGTHAQLKAAFHTEIHSYKLNGQTYYANVKDPQIPAAFANVVSGFSSLNNFPRHPQHTAPKLIRKKGFTWQIAPDASHPQPQFTTTSQNDPVYLVAPFDLATIYNVKPLWDAGIDGTGVTIAIVADSSINPADVDYFRTTFGLPPKKLNIIYYGPSPGLVGNEGEADLDVEWSGAVAKNATIDLVVANDSATSGGIDGAAAYIINNSLASILSVSFGECEIGLGTAGNSYYNAIWQQAAAQGITVLVASGDSGSGTCDQNHPYATHGLTVNGLGSTPYNISVGGTDFHSTFTDPAKYWNATNDPTTLASVKSYLPESTWNDSCASPQILAALLANGYPNPTTEALCNDANEQPYFLTTAGGSGGASNCSVSGATCTSGTPKPAWQSGVTGIPADGVRDLPDVSLMAGNGIWGSFYPYCQSDAVGGACDVNNALEGAGGTSFASPIFAGMMALVQQKTASMQGNANYVLYKLAAAQYAGANAASCASDAATPGNACIFYDVTDSTIAVPCYAGTPNCAPAVSGDSIGILPGYDAGKGYDLATGLGSVNLYNLVQGWATAAATFLPTTTTLTAPASTTVAYGTTFNVNVAVAPVAPATGSPSGDVGVTTDSTALNNNSVGAVTLVNSAGTVPAILLAVGTYNLYATYAGDATFAPSKSTGLAVTVTQATATGALTATRTAVLPAQKVSFSASITGIAGGLPPTGTVLFTDSTNGFVFGTVKLSPNASTGISIATVLATAAQLQLGKNLITATYSGDATYLASPIPSLTIPLSGSFTTTIAPGSLTLAPSGAGTALVTVTPTNGTVLTAAAISLACPTTPPAGMACSFSPAAIGAGGIITSTLTLQLASPLGRSSAATSQRAANTQHRPTNLLGLGAAASLATLLCFFLPTRRRRSFTTLTLIASCALLVSLGCGGSGKPALIATTTSLTTPTSPALGSPATFTAKVAAISGTVPPTGTITFASGTTNLGTGTLIAGAATLTTSTLPVGSQPVTASYAGDALYAPSISAAGSVDVVFTGTLAVTASDTVGDQSTTNLTVIVQ